MGLTPPLSLFSIFPFFPVSFWTQFRVNGVTARLGASQRGNEGFEKGLIFCETAPVSLALRGEFGLNGGTRGALHGSTTTVGVVSTHQHPSFNSRCRDRRLRQVRLSLGFNIGKNAGFYLIACNVLLPPPPILHWARGCCEKRRKREIPRVCMHASHAGYSLYDPLNTLRKWWIERTIRKGAHSTTTHGWKKIICTMDYKCVSALLFEKRFNLSGKDISEGKILVLLSRAV